MVLRMLRVDVKNILVSFFIPLPVAIITVQACLVCAEDQGKTGNIFSCNCFQFIQTQFSTS